MPRVSAADNGPSSAQCRAPPTVAHATEPQYTQMPAPRRHAPLPRTPSPWARRPVSAPTLEAGQCWCSPPVAPPTVRLGHSPGRSAEHTNRGINYDCVDPISQRGDLWTYDLPPPRRPASPQARPQAAGTKPHPCHSGAPLPATTSAISFPRPFQNCSLSSKENVNTPGERDSHGNSSRTGMQKGARPVRKI